MSSSSSSSYAAAAALIQLLNQDDLPSNNNYQRQKPEWVESLMAQNLHSECPYHSTPAIVTNRYCIECNNATCHHCLKARGAHRSHTVLTVYKHMHCSVVPVDEIKNLMDCSRIQIYKNNKKWVLSLIPLPHVGSCDHSITAAGDCACLVCKRKLPTIHGRFSFCSISCKFEFDAINSGDGLHVLLSAARTIEAKEQAIKQYNRK